MRGVGERRHPAGGVPHPAGRSSCFCAAVPQAGGSRFSGGTPETAAKMAALPKPKEIKNQRKCFVRRRSSKPLVISPNRVNDEVTSGTALISLLAPRKPLSGFSASVPME